MAPIMRHLLTLADLTTAEIERIFSITEDLKTKFDKGLREPLLPGRVMALLFEKPSLRTRVSFEAGMAHLGGSSLFLGQDVGFGRRESIADFGRVLGEYVDVIVRPRQSPSDGRRPGRALHLLGHQRPDRFRPPLPGAGRSVHDPRIGRQRLEGHTLAWIGDANNVARSVALGCGKLGMRLVMATPREISIRRRSRWPGFASRRRRST